MSFFPASEESLREGFRGRDIVRLKRVTMAYPAGNLTAVVWDKIPADRQVKVATAIQQRYADVEQVMFADSHNKDGQMAGGEFCGNASRSLAYLMQEGISGQSVVNVSGTARSLSVDITPATSEIEIPLPSDRTNLVETLDTGEHIVSLEGISFLVTNAQTVTGAAILALQDPSERTAFIKEVLGEKNLLEKEASGIMVVDRHESGMKLDPFVYVRNADTLYYETGCGSGTAAVGIVEAMQREQSISNLEIRQPSGEPLTVSVQLDENRQPQHISIGGGIQIRYDGPLTIPISKEPSQLGR